jgi:hypothetical protein
MKSHDKQHGDRSQSLDIGAEYHAFAGRVALLAHLRALGRDCIVSAGLSHVSTLTFQTRHQLAAGDNYMKTRSGDIICSHRRRRGCNDPISYRDDDGGRSL